MEGDAIDELLAVPGVRLGTVSAGVKTPGRKDLVLLEIADGATCVGVFTQNAFCAAPVTVAKQRLNETGISPRYLLVNTGNANAGTGEAGIEAATACTAAVADRARVLPAAVLPFSTGVIGEPLPVETICSAIPQVFEALSENGWAEAAQGILTTDTRPKGVSRTFSVNGEKFVVTGIAKGAGMIRPNMATMLAFLATDVVVERHLLQDLLAQAVAMSFNRITVDGDTSTNDACVLVATGETGTPTIGDPEEPQYCALRDALCEVCVALAQALIRDGEGASKFVTIDVNGGYGEQECLDVAYTIAHSPLVKTALFAADPNWGRLLAAIGRAGVPELDVDRVDVFINNILIAQGGSRAATYTEELGEAAMAPQDITIRIELNRGESGATVWTTDFSYDYVRINAEYRT
ncbi:MAG: bifunctional glutamate N-acetyltransferase/amino-acid acetyltransferase ArgJ [Halieaceae bacterium]|jgi:glutamate N-acetyltransferase / amino-acid N-acetyltransferase|nr:bifunctional glutamate N-acetyltransferase/amino-acid acetyltransferase ArgJ [Halieaceae bacterium]